MHRFIIVQINGRGYVLVATMFLLLLLTIVGIAATRTSIIELQLSGNYSTLVQGFYTAEGAVTTALERTDWWLSNDFLNSDARLAHWSKLVDTDSDGVDDVCIEIRCIEQDLSRIAALSDAANDIPADLHKAPPPMDSGYSVRHFYTRKYAVTATGLESNNRLQSGAWKVFNKY